MQKILKGLWRYLFKPYLLAAGLIITLLVSRQFYLQTLDPPNLVKMQLHLKLPDLTAKTGG